MDPHNESHIRYPKVGKTKMHGLFGDLWKCKVQAFRHVQTHRLSIGRQMKTNSGNMWDPRLPRHCWWHAKQLLRTEGLEFGGSIPNNAVHPVAIIAYSKVVPGTQ